MRNRWTEEEIMDEREEDLPTEAQQEEVEEKGLVGKVNGESDNPF